MCTSSHALVTNHARQNGRVVTHHVKRIPAFSRALPLVSLVRGGLAVTAACQRGKQARPLRPPLMPAMARDERWQADGRQPRLVARAAFRPCAAVGYSVISNGPGFSWKHPPWRRGGVALPAGWANQPAQSILTPARKDRSGPVVRLPECDRIGESRRTPRHVTPGDGGPDLVPDDAVPGNRNRMDQRIEAPRRPRGQAVAARLRPD